jgi:hypothetical protein
MIELFSSIGVIGVVMLIVGFGLIWWLAQIIDDKNLFDDEGDSNE